MTRCLACGAFTRYPERASEFGVRWVCRCCYDDFQDAMSEAVRTARGMHYTSLMVQRALKGPQRYQGEMWWYARENAKRSLELQRAEAPIPLP